MSKLFLSVVCLGSALQSVLIIVMDPALVTRGDTASFEGTPPGVGGPASLFRLVLSVVCDIIGRKII